MLMKSISALITQVPHLPTHSNLTTTTFSAWTPLGENYLEYFKSQVVFSTRSLMAFYCTVCTLSKSSILLLFEETWEPGEMEDRYGLTPSWSTWVLFLQDTIQRTLGHLSPADWPWSPWILHFLLCTPTSLLIGRLAGLYKVLLHRTPPLPNWLHCTALPHLH